MLCEKEWVKPKLGQDSMDNLELVFIEVSWPVSTLDWLQLYTTGYHGMKLRKCKLSSFWGKIRLTIIIKTINSAYIVEHLWSVAGVRQFASISHVFDGFDGCSPKQCAEAWHSVSLAYEGTAPLPLHIFLSLGFFFPLFSIHLRAPNICLLWFIQPEDI